MLKQNLDRRLLFWLVALLIGSVAVVGVANAQTVVVTTVPTPNAATITSIAPTPDPLTSTLTNAASDAATSITGVAEGLWSQLSQPPQSDLARVLLILGGVVLLIAGWVVYDWIILIAGFLIGGTAALTQAPQSNALIALLVFLIGGVAGAFLASIVYYLAVFLIGAYMGIVIAQGIAVALNLTPLTTVGVLVSGIVGGLLLVLLAQELLVILSSLVGAQMIALALNLGIGWMLLLTLIGIVVQFAGARARGVELRRRPLRRTLWTRRATVE